MKLCAVVIDNKQFYFKEEERMKRKKLLSTAVAGMLVAAQMVMPVMAADGGGFNVDLTTKTGVLRVEVPTSMAVAVDQFEIGQTGAQIESGEFDMINKSEMDVKVTVTSTATLGTDISLVSSRTAAENSTGDQAWLAVAAKTGASSYDDTTTTTPTENYWDLTDANANVTTFGDGNKAEQTFYLEKATGGASYKLAVPDANGKVTVGSYTQFYLLTELTTQPSDDATLQTAVNDNDVYVVATSAITTDDSSVTKIAKGTTVAGGANAWATGNTYYTAVSTASTPTNGSVYVYAEMATAGADGKAGFMYVGKLSNARETWTATDISRIAVAYTITGVTATKYGEVASHCTYGLYKEPAPAATAPSITTTTYTMVANQAINISVDLGSGNKAASTVSSVTYAGNNVLGGLATYSNGTVTITSAAVNNLRSLSGDQTITIVFDDTDTTSIPITLQH